MSNHGGTVYGKGGLDARPPRQGGLHPAVLALVGGAAIVLVVALVYWVVREPAQPATSSAAVASGGPSVEATTAATATAEASPSAGPAMRTGKWVLALAGEPERRLGEEDDFAAITTDDPLTVTVVRGLADGDCFSFRNEDGDFLRHFDYRLRFDERDDAELFRADATFCADGAGGAIRLRSKNYPEHVIHRRGSDLYIDEPDGSARSTADSTFTLQEPRS